MCNSVDVFNSTSNKLNKDKIVLNYGGGVEKRNLSEIKIPLKLKLKFFQMFYKFAFF